MKFFKLFLIYLSIFLIDLKFWISNSFGERVKADNLISHILSGPTELLGADDSLITSFFSATIAMPALNYALILYLCYLVTRDSFPNENSYIKSKTLTKTLLLIKKIITRLNDFLFKKFTTPLLLLFSILYFAHGLDVISFIQTLYGKDFFSDAYAPPDLVKILMPDKKKNLIILYVESLEQNLRDSNIQGTNLIEPIDNLDGFTVPHFLSTPGTGWSIAGMVASQCSIPTIPYLKVGAHAKNFLPNAICLGDILARDGYEQYFLSGPDLQFAGMDKFYKDHGYQHAMGKSEWREKKLDSSLFTSWGSGIHDDTLLKEAKKIIIQMKSARKVYNLTLITTDSHASKGTPSSHCLEQEKASGFKGAFQCTSKFVANFINELKKENLLNDTVVVIMGDHPFLNNKNQSAFFPEPRYIYIKFITNDIIRPLRDNMTHFDVAPSILELLGYIDSSNPRFGLGFSLFSKIDKNKYDDHIKLVTDHKILNHSLTYKSFFLTKAKSAKNTHK